MSKTPQRQARSAVERSHPILDCAAAAELEKSLLTSDDAVWQAMQRVGLSLARAIRADIAMARPQTRGLKALALIGKGHNGGDALLALRRLLDEPALLRSIALAMLSPVSELKPHTRRAFEMLEKRSALRIVSSESELRELLRVERFDLCIDGALGMQFRPPLREKEAAWIKALNESPNLGFRAAVDLPSGVGHDIDPGAFVADATYATGLLKKPALGAEQAGALRYLDIGFFDDNDEAPAERVLTDRILDSLREWRPARSEKRQFGHLAILAGSRNMPGALAMCVAAAIRSGVGLVTVLAPESMVPHLAVAYPEAMWRAWPETPEGGLALEGTWQMRGIAEKANALLVGPGLGREKETQAMLRDALGSWSKPVLLDADALMPDAIDALAQGDAPPAILTPHAGEFARLAGEGASDEALSRYAEPRDLCVVLKGSSTRVRGGGRTFVNTTGNAVLSRGGAGDILAGLTAGLLAQFPEQPVEAACMGVHWHGKAADLWAMQRGQTAARTTDLLDFLAPALETGEAWNLSSPASRPFGS